MADITPDVQTLAGTTDFDGTSGKGLFTHTVPNGYQLVLDIYCHLDGTADSFTVRMVDPDTAANNPVVDSSSGAVNDYKLLDFRVPVAASGASWSVQVTNPGSTKDDAGSVTFVPRYIRLEP